MNRWTCFFGALVAIMSTACNKSQQLVGFSLYAFAADPRLGGEVASSCRFQFAIALEGEMPGAWIGAPIRSSVHFQRSVNGPNWSVEQRAQPSIDSVRLEKLEQDTLLLVLHGEFTDTLRGHLDEETRESRGEWVCRPTHPLANSVRLVEAGQDSTRAINGSWQLQPRYRRVPPRGG